MQRLILPAALLTGMLTVLLLGALFSQKLSWWVWLPVQGRPALLFCAGLANFTAFYALWRSRRYSANRLHPFGMILNLVLFAIMAAFLCVILFLTYGFRM